MIRSMLLMAVCGVVISSVCPAETPLTVMSFNLRHAKGMDGPNSWPHRKDILVDTIRRTNPDILGTQECLEEQALYIAQNLSEYHWMGVGRDTNGGGEMSAIFYKREALSPVESGTFWLSETPEVPGSVSWDSSLTRIVTWAKFHHRQSGQFFYFFNTHFDHKGAEARLQSAHLLAKRFEAMDPQTPLILTGDFNSDGEKSPAWPVLQAAGMQDTWLTAEKKEGPAVTTSLFKAPDPDHGTRIDWIMTRGPITATYFETITFNQDGRYPSDHYPVMAKVVLK